MTNSLFCEIKQYSSVTSDLDWSSALLTQRRRDNRGRSGANSEHEGRHTARQEGQLLEHSIGLRYYELGDKLGRSQAPEMNLSYKHDDQKRVAASAGILTCVRS
jgi:hypothetical protein